MSADAPRKPAIRTVLAGVTFAVLFAAALVLIERTPKLGSAAHVYEAFYASPDNETLVTVGLYVIPFAGIAFLWFMMALTRRRCSSTPRGCWSSASPFGGAPCTRPRPAWRYPPSPIRCHRLIRNHERTTIPLSPDTNATTDIPGPAPKPLIGNATDIDRENAIESVMDLARRYGPIYRLTIPGAGDRYIVSGRDLVEEVCDERRFDKLVTGGLSEVRSDPVSAGLFTAETDNPLWRRAHNILLPNFSQQAMQDYHPMMLDIADQLVRKWERLNPGDEVDVSEDMTRLTLDTIALCGFGYRFNSFYRETAHPFVAAMVRTLQESQTRARELRVQRRLRPGAARQLAEDTAFMERLVDEIIAERRRTGTADGRGDLLSAMLDGVDRQSGEGLPDVNIRAQCITFLIAGHETTSALLTFAIHYMLKDPQVMARAQAEADRVLGEDPQVLPTAAQVGKLTFITQILDEALRLWPTAPGFNRFPLRDTIIGGRYRLAAGAAVTVLTPMLHRDGSVWGDDAESFNPDHFSPERRAALPPYAFYPFGAGQRACIGRQFAMREAALVLGMILQRFDLADPHDYQLEIAETLTIKPVGLMVTARPRPGREPGLARTTPAEAGAPATATAPPATGQVRAGAHGTPLTVLFGSNLGTAEAIAGRLAQQGVQRGFRVNVGALDDRVGELDPDGALIIVASSYNGSPPDNAVAFCDWLRHGAAHDAGLAGLGYAVFGCGSRDWAATYQAVPELIDNLLLQAGATRIHPRGEGDAAGDFDDQFEHWAADVWPALGEALGLDTGQLAQAGVRPGLTISLTNRQTANPVVAAYQAQPALITVNRELQDDGEGGGWRSTRHVEIALPAGVSYRTGDHLGVLPRNDAELVTRVMRHFELDAGMWMEISADGAAAHTHLPTGLPTPLLGILACSVELQSVASHSDVALMADYTDDPVTAARLRTLSDPGEMGRRRFEEEVLAPHRTLIDLLSDFPTCTMPFEVYLERLPALRPRYYSISSSPSVQPDTCSITVGVVGSETGNEFTGVCSGYLSRSGERTTIFPFVRSPTIPFHPPANPHAPMIMVGCGTGLAPFRGFLQERASQQAEGVPVGPSLLFFGCRHPEQDFLYEHELRDYEERGLTTVALAASRLADRPRTYVQDLIAERDAEVWELLEAGAGIYVCGDASRMAPDVRAAFMGVARERGGLSETEAEAWLADLRTRDRYLEDIWGGGAARTEPAPAADPARGAPSPV
jgi:cytochrome P450 / NADPH-cytochrome P450 reductase